MSDKVVLSSLISHLATNLSRHFIKTEMGWNLFFSKKKATNSSQTIHRFHRMRGLVEIDHVNRNCPQSLDSPYVCVLFCCLPGKICCAHNFEVHECVMKKQETGCINSGYFIIIVGSRRSHRQEQPRKQKKQKKQKKQTG